jgi:hypothetical protein
MKLPRWSISECRDGHYRSKEDLRNQSEEAKLNAAAVDSVEDALSRESQNPVEISGTRIGKAYQEAAGIPAMLNTARYGFREMGVIRTARTSYVRTTQALETSKTPPALKLVVSRRSFK